MRSIICRLEQIWPDQDMILIYENASEISTRFTDINGKIVENCHTI